MDGCYYATLFGKAFGVTQVLPSLITLNMSVMSMVTSEIIFVLYGLYLHLMQLFLWVFQYYFQQMHINPVCQQYQNYAFPSIETFYAASLVMFVITYSYRWEVVHSWYTWMMLLLIGILPPFILIFLSYNSLTDILISMGLGMLLTGLFVIILDLFIGPTLPYILTEFPASWMGYKDTYIMRKNIKKEFIRCENLKKIK